MTPTPTPPSPAGKAPRKPTYLRRLPGRPKLLTDEVRDRFMTALRAGNSQADAARYAGLKPDTVEKWMRRGRGVHQRPATPEYVEFYRLAEESKAAARVYVVGNLVARSRVDTRAAEVWLRVHGGPEWRDDDAMLPEGSTTFLQQNNVIVLPPDMVPETVRNMLAARRAAMPEEPDIVTEERGPDGPSGARDNGLREDG